MWWLDDYERRARLIPGLWLIAPAVVLILMFGLRSSPVISAAGGLLVAAGGPVLLSALVRQRGLIVEPELIRKWGGWPTTQLLTTGTPGALASRRKHVESATGVQLPPSHEASSDGYDVAVAILRDKTRSTDEFPLVFTENRNYGFERNLVGVQPVARVTSSTAALAGIAAASLVARHRHAVSVDLWMGAIFLVAVAVFWFVYPSEDRAKSVAFKYAERLLDAAGRLSV